MPYLSIVIPVYNNEKTILRLITSIIQSGKTDLSDIEVIAVDDKSKDSSIKTMAGYASQMNVGQLHGFRIIALNENSGPAKVRNVGSSYARGKVLLFLDSDVILHKSTLGEVIRSFQEDPDLHALTGVWDKKQYTKKFFPKFKALRDWSYWINERDPRNYYYLFSTRIAAIDRGLFLRLGGFDTTYKAALVEDMELTYRIAKRYAVVFSPKVMVHHEFEDFLPVAKKYFWRSYYWSRIYRERKKFDPVATTSKEALTTVAAAGLVGFSLLSVVSHLGNLTNLGYLWGVAAGIAFFIHLWGVRKFIWFCVKEEGMLFSLRAFVTGIILYIVIISGALYSFLR